MMLILFALLLLSLDAKSHVTAELENEIFEDSFPSCGENIPPSINSRTKTVVGEYPWIALIGFEDVVNEKVFYACTGSLISDRYVLTTAVCILKKHAHEVNRLSHVRLGEHNIKTKSDCFETSIHQCVTTTSSLDVGIEETIPHPEYNERDFQSDNIALLRLETTNFDDYFGFVNPVCLPPAGVNSRILLKDSLVDVVGWDFGSGNPTEVLMREFLSAVDDGVCEKTFRGFDGNTQICMMSEKKRTRCTGDSGSPLTFVGPNERHLLIGILSYGPIPCKGPKSPSVFTSVSFYRDWIDRNMRP